MSFTDCIATAVETGKLSASKAAEADEAYQRHFKETGYENLASMKALEEVTILKKAKRWERVNELKKQHANYQEIMQATDLQNLLASRGPWSSFNLNSMMERVDRHYAAISDQIMATMDKVVNAFTSTHLGFVRPLENMDNIVRYLYGETVEPAAKVLGEQSKAAMDLMVKMQNLEGASITISKNYRVPQIHDRFLVRDATKDVWVSEHLVDGVLDWDEMRYHGKQIPADQRQAILEDVWESIVSEGRNKIDAANSNNETLAARVSRQRFLLYKSADSWLEMNRKYGQGNLYEQLLGHVETTSRYVALMHQFGPNPKAGAEFVKRSLNKRLEELGKTMKAKPYEKLKTQVDREIRAFDEQFAIQNHDVDLAAGDALVQGVNTVRTMVGTANLGGLAIMTLSDPFYGMWFKQMMKLPFTSYLLTLPRYIQGIAAGKRFEQQLINDGIGTEAALAMIHDSQRYTMGAEGNHLARVLSQANYRITMASRITNVGRGIMGQDFAKALAHFNETPFEEIPFSHIMQQLGITEKDWNLVKDTPLQAPESRVFGKGQYLRPIDMWKHAGSEAARNAASKFLMFQEFLVRGAVPSPSIGSRGMLGGAISPRTLSGQFLRASAQFMLFPASIMFNHWKIAMMAPTALEKAYRIGMLVAYTTAGGAMIQQIKEILKGNGFQNMDPTENPEFWLKSAVIGGAGGIVGDWIYNNLAAVNHPSTSPVAEFGKKTANVVIEPLKWAYGSMTGDEEMVQRSKPGRAALELAWGIFPKPQPFRLAMERMIYDPLLQHTDPAAFARRASAAQRARDEKGQTAWWGIDDR